MATAKRKTAKRASKRKPTVAQRVAKHRAALKAKGMRLVQIWVPDPDNPNFIKEARREMRLLAKAAADPTSDEAQVMRELDAAFDEMMAEIARDETR
jgi:Antitoxin MazE-like